MFKRLGPVPRPVSSKAATLVVSSYRLLGFAILTIIVVALVAYISATVFYVTNTTWTSPIAASESDERVVALRSRLIEEQSKRDRLAAELAETDRVILEEQQFAIEFTKAIKHDLGRRKVALGQARSLASSAATARSRLARLTRSYSEESQHRLNAQAAAGRIDQSDLLADKYQAAQIAQSNLSLAERQSQFEQRAAELTAETRSLDAILADKAAITPLSYDVLRIKREYAASKLALAKAIDARDSLRAELARQNEVLASIEGMPYLRALKDRASIAFAPYPNLDGVARGTRVYACRIGMVLCRDVGSVLEVLAGEVTFQHPRRDKLLRGRMIELELVNDEMAAAEDDVLFLGNAPLWL